MSVTLKSIVDFWREYRRYPIGLVGLGLLLLLIIAALTFPIFGDYEVVKNWLTNQEYFQDYPRAVPPCWVGLLTGQSQTQTVIAKDAEVARYVAVEGPVQGEDGYVRYRITATFTVTGATEPSDVALEAYMSYQADPPGVLIEEIKVVRPDGKEFYLVKPVLPGGLNVNLPLETVAPTIGTVFGYPNTKLPGADVPFSLVGLAQNPVVITRFILPTLTQEYGAELAGASLSQLLTNVYRAIFSDDIAAALKGEAYNVLQGDYQVVITFAGKNLDMEIEPKKFVVKGSCYGLLGTDDKGRPLDQGIYYGVRWALIIGLLTSVITVVVGTLYGIAAGYIGGIVDEVLLRFAQVIYSLPVLPLLILLAALFKPNIWMIIILIVAFSWPGISFVTRSMALQIKSEPYVEAAIAAGAGTLRILILYILPQVLPYMFASMALSVPGAVIAEASLSFLGLGDPDLVTWGKILYDAQDAGAALNGYWWWVIPPGLAIALVGMTFVFIGNALDTILNPKLKR